MRELQSISSDRNILELYLYMYIFINKILILIGSKLRKINGNLHLRTTTRTHIFVLPRFCSGSRNSAETCRSAQRYAVDFQWEVFDEFVLGAYALMHCCKIHVRDCRKSVRCSCR